MPPVAEKKITPPAPAPVTKVAAPDPQRPVLTSVALEVPMTRLPGDPYKQRNIDLTLTAVEAQALRDLYDGLTVKGEFANRASVPKDAIRWMLARAGEAFAAARK